MFEGCEKGGCGFGWVAGVVVGGHDSWFGLLGLEFREILSFREWMSHVNGFRLGSSRRINGCWHVVLVLV